MKILCYNNMPSHYQEAFYKELNKFVELEVIYENDLSDERKKLGWSSDLKGYRFQFQRGIKPTINSLIHSYDFIFLNGFPGNFYNLLSSYLYKSKRWGTYSEMPEPSDRTLIWRLASFLFAKTIKSGKCVLFGIGEQIRTYYLQLGIPDNMIFPFAYFPEPPAILSQPKFDGPIVFVGQLIERKGIDLLIKAVSNSKFLQTKSLIVIGSGPKLQEYKELSNYLGIAESVRFLGHLRTSIVYETIKNASCLILPSRHEGWGAVINEAIHLGLPSIVSDVCGASELIKNGNCGIIFDNNNAIDLQKKIELLLNDYSFWKNCSENCLSYSHKITPSSGVRYFLEVVNYSISSNKSELEKPKAPWLNEMNE